MNTEDILKAEKYITNILNENYIILDGFKKEIEANKNSKTSYSTLVYDNRIRNCNTILEALSILKLSGIFMKKDDLY